MQFSKKISLSISITKITYCRGKKWNVSGVFFEFGPIKAYALQNMKDSVPVCMLGHVYLVLMTNCS